MGVSRIRIGVCGVSGADTVRFFRQLVRKNNLPVPVGSRLADFMVADDTAALENLDIKIDTASFIVGAVGVRQTTNADGLIFFFDPSVCTAKHFADERLRAKQLIDHVLATRQNRLLPIVFVLTHRDRWSPEQVRLVEEWIEQVGDYLTDTYSKTLRNHFPPMLVWKEHVFHLVSIAEESQTGESLGVMGSVRKLVELTAQFRRKDHRHSLGLIAFFILCMVLILGIPYLGFTSPTIRQTLNDLRNRLAPILHLPIRLVAPAERIDLAPLFDASGEFTETEARSLNRSLFLLMKRLNKLEEGGQPATDDDLADIELWNRAVETVRDRFAKDPAPDRLERYGILLNSLTDISKRQPRVLDEMLKDYWMAYRQQLLGELRQELAIHWDATTPPAQILVELCVRLEAAFRDITESVVRSDTASGTNGETRKESLKQDIRKAFIACRNYIDRVPLEIVIVSALYESDKAIDHDFHRRLVFSGGQEKGEVFIDLTISTSTPSLGTADLTGKFLPSRKEFTLSFVPDRPLNVGVQLTPKGAASQWEKFVDWDLLPPATETSLAPLGIPFYQKFENEENTSYLLAAEGYKLELTVRRPRNVPELLWEIVDETRP